MKKEILISFYVDYHFINATSLDEKYKDKIYPIVLMEAVIRISKPRKPHSVLRTVEKSHRARKSYGSFSAIMQEIKRDMDNMKSEFKIPHPPEMKSKIKKEELGDKKVILMLPPGKGAPIFISDEVQKYLDSKKIK